MSSAALWMGLTSLLVGGLADVSDVGPAMGRVGAVSAQIDSGAAAYYNPAGLAYRSSPQVRVGVQFLYSRLRIDERPIDVGAPWAIVAELATPVPLLAPVEDLFAVGVALVVLPTDVLQIEAPSTTDPILPYYENRTQRLVVVPALALKPHPNLAFGVGLNYFAGLTGIANVREGARGVLEADIEEEIYAAAAWHAGVRWRLWDFTLAFTYREPFAVDFRTRSDSVIADGALSLRIDAHVLYTPETFVFGASYQGAEFDLATDLSWRRWSLWEPPFARVRADAPLPSLGSEEQRLVTESRFTVPTPRDVWRFGVSGRYQLLATDLGILNLEGGYAYEPSPFDYAEAHLERSPINLLDGSKHFFGLGVRWVLPTAGRVRFTVHLASEVQVMADVARVKDPNHLPDEDPALPGRQTTNPGYPELTAGGWVLGGTASVGVELLSGETP